MSTDIKKSLTERYEYICGIIRRLEKAGRNKSEKYIKIRHRGDRAYYYLVSVGSGEKMIRKDNFKIVAELLQENYNKKLLTALKKEAKVMKKTLSEYPEITAEEIYETLSADRRKYIRPMMIPDEQFAHEWLEQPFEGKGFRETAPVYETIRGDRVRSKSEQIIADRLLAGGIPYKYECPLEMNGKVIHPDFTIMRMSDRTELYLEHCGMIDDPAYADKMVKRINDYSQSGILQGDRLFLLFETATLPLDARVVDKMINTSFR